MGMRTVLITGPTSGIGHSLAHLFAENGFSLILVSRYEETLSKLSDELTARYAVMVDFFAVDLSKPSGVILLETWLAKRSGNIEILVNNAGFGNYGCFEDTDPQTDTDLLNLNIVALTQITKILLPVIRTNKGKILNVGSVAAFLPGPFMNTYFASKAYVLSFSIALREEMKTLGVTVSCLCPGPTHTNFGKRAHYDHVLNRRHVMNATDVAKEGYRGLMAGKAIILPGWKNKAIAVLSSWVPKPWAATIVRIVSGY
jgi:short-subunit dehydrogenase